MADIIGEIARKVSDGKGEKNLATYSLHKFASGSLWAESYQVIHANNTPGVPVSAQGACNAERYGHP